MSNYPQCVKENQQERFLSLVVAVDNEGLTFDHVGSI